MYEPNHFPVSFCRFNLEQSLSSHFAAAAAAGCSDAAGRASPLSAPEMGGLVRHDDMAPSVSTSAPPPLAPSLRLNHGQLWQRFAAVGTEMVITKSGRHVSCA